MYKTAQKTTKTALLLMASASLLLTLAPTSSLAQTGVESGFTEEQKAELQTLFRQFINDNPVLMMESVRNYQMDQEKKEAQTAQESLKEYLPIFASKDLPMMGNSDGDVTIVEFFDYNCGYCKKAFSDIMKLVEKDKNVRVVLQDLPILSPTSQKMAELSLAAQKQGKYFEMHKALMEYRGSQSDEAFLKLAEDIGLDVEQLKKDAASAEVQASIAEIRKISQALGVRGTPGFIIGNQIYPGYIGETALEDAIKQAREDAKAK
jgi:protein-disulfide isomerase